MRGAAAVSGRFLLAAVFAASGVGACSAQAPAPARMSFEFENAALTPAAWRVEFDATGAGHYHSQPGEAAAPDAQGVSPQPFDQQIQVSTPMREQLFAIARSHHFLAYACESVKQKVAFTGHKTAAYAGPDGQGSCTFNWSPDARLMKLASCFQAVSLTLEEGRKLRLQYLHDRLSLDAELETLTTAVKNGTAMEIENIAPELQAIASDPAVMKRASARAAALLAGAPAGMETAAAQAR